MKMYSIRISGLPFKIQHSNLIQHLRTILRRVSIRKFWLREIVPMYEDDVADAIVELQSEYDAIRSKQLLDGFLFDYFGYKYRLIASFVEDERFFAPYPTVHPLTVISEDDNNYRYRESRNSPPRRSRSRSPVYFDRKISEINLEIAYLKKKRSLVEEECKLWLEKKRLEMIKENHPNIDEELMKLKQSQRDRSRRPNRTKRRDTKESESPKPQRESNILQQIPEEKPINLQPVENITVILSTGENSRKRLRSETVGSSVGTAKRPRNLPQFITPCRKLLLAMGRLIQREKLPPSVEAELVKKIRFDIRQKCARILKGKPLLNWMAILKLYREHYPRHLDWLMVSKHMEKLRNSNGSRQDSGLPSSPDASSTPMRIKQENQNHTFVKNESNEQFQEPSSEEKRNKFYESIVSDVWL